MRYGHREHMSWLAFEGAIRYTQARELKAFMDQVVIPEMGDTMVIDLRDVAAIDSTGLGLLASLGRHSLEQFSRRAVILCPEGPVAQCLRAMQFDKLFTLTDALEEPAELNVCPVDSTPGTEEPLSAVMLNAHRALSDVDDENKARFDDVVHLLEEANAKGR
jgi:anti-anti-sigma factor